ncbi:MAG: IRE (iron responsive element), partial [Rubripirellula sp.]
LDQLDVLERQKEEKIEQFRELVKEEYDVESKRLYDALPEALKETYNRPREEMTHNDKEMYVSIKGGLIPDLPSLARAADPSVRLRAIEIVGELDDLEERLIKTRGYRTQINYPYWKTLAQAEQEERTVKARRLIYEAEKANEDAELDKAIALYEESFAVWAEIFDDYPLLTVDDSAQDLFESLKRYSIAIDSEEMPEDFPLRTFVELMGEYGQVDAHLYTEIQSEAEEAMLARKKELAEEERLLEEAAKAEEEKAKMEKAEAEKAAKAKEKAAADKAAKEKADAESESDDKSESDDDESDSPKAESPDSESDSDAEASDTGGSDAEESDE